MRKLFFYLALLALVFSFTNVSAAVAPAINSNERVVPSPEAVKAALAEYKNLSKKEKKQRFKLLKQTLKEYKADKKAGKAADTNTLLLVILAILLPPLAVYLHQGEINSKFWISLLLTLLFWLPGVIYALIVILGDN